MEFLSLSRMQARQDSDTGEIIYKIYGVKKYYFGKTTQGAKKVSFTACHSGKL